MSAVPAIALLGPRGSGKSTVGVVLARLLGRAFVDLDERVLAVARHAGLRAASAGEVLATAGAARFRALEAVAVKLVLEPMPRIVVATGGGIVEREDNRAWLARAARCVYLEVPETLLRARLAADPTPRPPLLGVDAVDEVAAVLARRAPLYRALAEVTVPCGEDPPEAVAARVAADLGLAPRVPTA